MELLCVRRVLEFSFTGTHTQESDFLNPRGFEEMVEVRRCFTHNVACFPLRITELLVLLEYVEDVIRNATKKIESIYLNAGVKLGLT